MKLRPLSREEVRAIDARAVEDGGVPAIVLMENAGRAAAAWLVELGVRGPVAVCCGKGNNGGDGFVIARHLDAWGVAVHVLLACEPTELAGDALVNLRIVERASLPITRWDAGAADARCDRLIETADWIIDGLLGTGLRGEVRAPMRKAIDALNRSPAKKYAIDIPSGLDADTGRPLGLAVRASCTATFVSRKLGFTNPDAAMYTGAVRVFDIGIPRRLLAPYAA
jgi:NAD(P)H-hydrate epimerase